MIYADTQCKIVSLGDCYIVTGKDVFSGTDVKITIPSQQLYNYRQGMDIEQALYSLTYDEREFLISGIYDSFPEGKEEDVMEFAFI